MPSESVPVAVSWCDELTLKAAGEIAIETGVATFSAADPLTSPAAAVRMDAPAAAAVIVTVSGRRRSPSPRRCSE